MRQGLLFNHFVGVAREQPIEGDNPTARGESIVRSYATRHTEPVSHHSRGRSPTRHVQHRHGEQPSATSHCRRRRRHSSYSSSQEGTLKRRKTFEACDKDIKFQTFNGRRNVTKALAFIRQFEAAEENFTKSVTWACIYENWCHAPVAAVCCWFSLCGLFLFALFAPL